ncbi:MAG: hypothetical protein LBK26_00535 [Rickettsiales bacterium]|jgi:hypothetical protein|nr:hypothetical protein [Rickettsiales bacterium]
MQIPEKFQNQDGTLNPEALIKSYSELEKKIGTMVSLPNDDADDDSKARFNRAIGVPEDISGYPMHPLYDDDMIRKKFQEAGLNARQVEKIYEIANEFFEPALSEIFQSGYVADAMFELKSFFGSEEKMRESLTAIDAFAEKFLPKDTYESLCASSAGIRSIFAMMQNIEPSVSTSKNECGNLSDNDLRDMMRDPKYWRDRNPEYIRKIESGFKKLYS